MIKRLLKRVVVTGVGGEAGVAVAAVFKRHQWLVVGVDAIYSPAHVHQFYLVSSGSHPTFNEELMLIVRREKSTLVLPTRVEDVLALASYSREFQRLGASVYLPPAPIVKDLADKEVWPKALRRAGIAVEPGLRHVAVGNEQLYEVNLCVDVRAPYPILASSVVELFLVESSQSIPVFRSERRKDEVKIEEVARRVVAIYQVRGVLTIHVRMSADGVPVIAGVAATPCVHGPLSDGVYEALRVLWERDQPA